MLHILLALAVIVAILAVYYVGIVRMLLNSRSPFHRTRRRLGIARLAHREAADLDREYASLIDEHRHIP